MPTCEEELADLKKDNTDLHRQWVEARGQVERLETRTATLEAQLAALTAEKEPQK